MVCAEIADRVQGSCMRLESIRMCWGYKYLPPTPKFAPRCLVEALNGISELHPPRQHETLTGFERTLDSLLQPTHSRNHNNPYISTPGKEHTHGWHTHHPILHNPLWADRN